MEENPEVAVAVIDMKKIVLILLLVGLSTQAQDSLLTFKKKVLETTEIEMLMSAYKQEGTHAAVTGGIGNEALTNYTPTIVIKMPLSADEVLTADIGLSAYTSASSSNGNPFNKSGASGGGYDDDDHDDDGYEGGGANIAPTGSPWVASSGASYKDALTSISLNYAHSSDDRNTIWNARLSSSFEYDYESFGLGAGISKLIGDKNAEISLKGQVYLDRWKPVTPTEIHEFLKFGDSFLTNSRSYFNGVSVLDSQGIPSLGYRPLAVDFEQVNRNSYSVSFLFSQILSSFAQIAIFGDYVFQNGLLSNPLQRVYFSDRPNYFIGDAGLISQYESQQNHSVFQLADDVERLPDSRTKIPFGARLQLYLSESFVLRSYYRHYQDDWGIISNTLQLELPIKLDLRWKLTPTYRFYDQTAADYFAPFNQHQSVASYYTSDYDLSAFDSHQWGLGLGYTDLFTSKRILIAGFKSADIRFQNYKRSDGLRANIISTAVKFVIN
jgi:hypothetical protein